MPRKKPSRAAERARRVQEVEEMLAAWSEGTAWRILAVSYREGEGAPFQARFVLSWEPPPEGGGIL